MPNSPEPPENSPGKKATGSLRAGTGSLRAASEAAVSRTGERPVSAFRFPAQRSLGLRIGELVIFVAAIVGAVALGLGISDYLGAHPYIFGYLAAYAAFRFADLLVRGDRSLTRLSRRVTSQLPLLALFAGAPCWVSSLNSPGYGSCWAHASNSASSRRPAAAQNKRARSFATDSFVTSAIRLLPARCWCCWHGPSNSPRRSHSSWR